MRKWIRRVLPKDEKKYQHEWHAKYRKRQPVFESDRKCPADRILSNQHLVYMLVEELKTEGRDATIAFLDSLGCSGEDINKLLTQLCQK